MATTKHYGAMFASTDDQFDIQRAYHYYVDFSSVRNAFTTSSTGGLQTSNVIATSGTAIPGADETLKVAVQNFNLPTVSNSQIEYNYVNNKIKLAGQADIQTGDVTLVDFVVKDTELILLSWYNKVYDTNTEKTNLVSKYKFPVKLYQFAPDGSAVRAWQMEGCFPTSLQLGQLDYTQNDKKQITMTLSIDLAYRILGAQ